MLIYFITFILSALFAYLAYKSKMRISKIMFSILAILIPSLLAGLRCKGVGTDTLYYIDSAFNFAKASSSFANLIRISNIEILYNFVNYAVSRFTDNINVLYFILQLIICLFAYLASWKYKENCPSWLSYFILLILFYNRSLNMCRQSIALSISLFSFSYALDKKIFKYMVCIVLASCFHRTAIICIPIYFLVSMLQGKGKLPYKLLVFIMFAILFVLYKDIVKFITLDLKLISDRYLYYASDTNGQIIYMELLAKIFILVCCLVFYKELKRLNKHNHILIYFMVIDLLLYCLGFYANYAQRLSYYFGYYMIFLISQLVMIFKKSSMYHILLAILLVSCLTYSYVYYEVAGYDETVPFKSNIVNIGVG